MSYDERELQRLQEENARLKTMLSESQAAAERIHRDYVDILTSVEWRAGRELGRWSRRIVPARWRPTLLRLAKKLARGLNAAQTHVAARRQARSHTTTNAAAPPRGHAGPMPLDRRRVDAVICVHNALPHVQNCIRSVLRHRREQDRIVVVDDGSALDTQQWLAGFCAGRDGVHLIRHETAQGYTRAANAGLRASDADVVVLLNSDTIVTPNWRDNLLHTFDAMPEAGIVGPLSNAASWQSVPACVDPHTGDWALNPLPDGWTQDHMAAIVEAADASPLYTDLLNGFCFAISKRTLEQIGHLDEARFPQGYGEETDYCLRAKQAGIRCAVARNVYVYHAKSQSFGNERRKTLAATGAATLESRYGAAAIRNAEASVRHSTELASYRAVLADALTTLARGAPQTDAIAVVFLITVAAGAGGIHSVMQEADGLSQRGLSVRVAVPQDVANSFRAEYGLNPGMDRLLAVYSDIDSLAALIPQSGWIVATNYASASTVRDVIERRADLRSAYYVQDYEPLFHAEGSAEARLAGASYTLVPGMLCFAKTSWIADRLAEHHSVRTWRVSASLDHEVYYPGASLPDFPVHIAAMVRPTTPRRAARRHVELLQALKRIHGDAIRISTFGASDETLAEFGLVLPAGTANLGKLRREGVADLLRTSHIFVDLSDYQAFGRTALEAMACGCCVAITAHGGVGEFALNADNAMLVLPDDLSACVEAVGQLIESPRDRERLRARGLATAGHYSVAGAALSEHILVSSNKPII